MDHYDATLAERELYTMLGELAMLLEKRGIVQSVQ
jgi:hypothetical protein